MAFTTCSLYAQRFNERRGRVGHVFQGRYGSVHITCDEQLWTTVAYVALNPVNAGLCRGPEEWPWSSHASTTDGRRGHPWLDVERLLSHFEGPGGDPRQRYAAATVSRR